jgi:hypothetical protein
MLEVHNQNKDKSYWSWSGSTVNHYKCFKKEILKYCNHNIYGKPFKTNPSINIFNMGPDKGASDG